METKKLKSYLADIGITVRQFCEKLDCNYSHMSGIVTGRKTPGKRLARDIFEATSGMVRLKTREKREKMPKQIKSEQVVKNTTSL